MTLNISNEIRKQLLEFLTKVLNETYTQNEWEKFAIGMYQNNDLEHIRIEIVKIISSCHDANNLNKKKISEENKKLIRELIDELDRIII